MAKGNKKHRYRIRYDRVIAAVLTLVIVGVLITSCTKVFFGENEKDPGNSNLTLESSDITENPEETTENIPEQTETAVTTEPVTETPEYLLNYRPESHDYSDIYKGNLVLVNAQYEYRFPENDVDVVTIVGNRNDYYEAGDYVTKLDIETLHALNTMIEAFAVESNIEGRTGIFVQYGFRTYEEQVDLHSTGKSRTFEAGHTDYHTGRTFDMFCNDSDSTTGYSYFTATGKYEWFEQNVANYGFIVRFPENKENITGERPRAYTYRYVGVPHAVYMRDNNLCMEEYISGLKTHTIDNPLAISACGINYSVYYVPAKQADINEIYVPKDKFYTVSGNNADGFIVTVTE